MPNPNKYNKKNNNKKDKLVKTLVLRGICPDTITVPLSIQGTYAFSAAYTGTNQFQMNSAYDPDLTNVGQQPCGFDQWSAFYNRYRVEKCRVEVDFVNLSTTSVVNSLVVANNDNTVINTNARFLAASESPFAMNTVLALQGSQSHHKFVRDYDIATILGVPKARYIADSSYSATTAANPGEIVTLHVVAQDLQFNSNITVQCRVKLTMLTTFFDRNQLAQS